MWWRLGLLAAVAGFLGVRLGFPVNPWGLHVYAAGLVLDLWTTLHALEIGHREANPVARLFLRLGPWGLPLASLLVLTIMGASTSPFEAAFILGSVHLVAGLHNLRLLVFRREPLS